MKVGDLVRVSPDLTHKSDWVQATVVEVEQNPYAGLVITAKTGAGEYFFGYADLFRPARQNRPGGESQFHNPLAGGGGRA